MKLSLGFSPCPNDTFIFDALIHHKIDTEGLEFEVHLEDVEGLNQMAFAQKLDITKLSYHAFAYLQNEYALLHAGSALGNNCGPILIAKEVVPKEEVKDLKIAIPGKYTTANFLLSIAFPKAQQKVEMLFSDIEEAILKEEVDAGLIIHENRFTYQAKGLNKIVDLGEYWEGTTQLPIPLGGIVINRKLDPIVQQKVNRVLKKSILFAFDHPKSALPYIRRHAQEMDETVMYQHINLYVNEFTKDLGIKGKAAVEQLFEVAHQKNIIPKSERTLFIVEQ